MPDYVHETDKDKRAAYLYGFRIDSARLRSSHKKWLDKYIINRAKFYAQGHRLEGFGHHNLKLWIIGLASRTGSAEHNENLSIQRVKAVEDYIKPRLNGVVIDIRKKGRGEKPAEVLGGHENDVEDAFYRSTFVSFSAQEPNPLPKIKRCPKTSEPVACKKSMTKKMNKHMFHPEEQEEALALVDWWNRMESKGKPKKEIREAIITYLVDEYIEWLRLVYLSLQDLCNDPKRRPKGIEVVWGDPCRLHPKGHRWHFRSKIAYFRMKLRLLYGSDECDQVYRWYFWLRIHTTDIMRLMRAHAIAMGIAAFVSALAGLSKAATTGNGGPRPSPKAPTSGGPKHQVNRRFKILKKRLQEGMKSE